MVGPLAGKLTKHFTKEISARLKVMLIIGYVQYQMEGSGKEECISKMSVFGWGSGQKLVSGILFDVLMRAL